MNFENPIGINKDQFIANLNNFILESNNISTRLSTSFETFSYGLTRNWASEKAIAFGTEYASKIDQMLTMYNEKIKTICIHAIEAFNLIALTCGETQIDPMTIIETISTEETDFVNKLKFESNINNVTGMNISAVKGELLPTLDNNIKEIYNMIDSLPTEIALLDDGNGMKKTYQTGIQEMKTDISAFLMNLNTKINDSLETETNAILSSKAKAEEIIKGTN